MIETRNSRISLRCIRATVNRHLVGEMALYRRNRVAGGAYFFTVTLRNRSLSLLVDRIDDLRESVRYALQKRPFRIDAWVVLPEHLHAVWTLPPGDHAYSGRWQVIKGRFSHRLARAGVPIAKNRRGEYNLWQSRFWEHTIRNDADFAHHIDYIHHNPVKHGLLKRVRDWPYSTFNRYVEAGSYSLDWGGDALEGNGDYRESISAPL